MLFWLSVLAYQRRMVYRKFVFHLSDNVNKTKPMLWYVSVGVLVGNFLARIVYRNRTPLAFKDFMTGFPTSLEVLPGGMTRMVIQCPTQLRWRPGQHCYISVPGIS